MERLMRAPCPPLRPFVRAIWTLETPASATTLERVLPTGDMHLVIRLSPEPLTIFADETGASPRVIGRAVIGGARSRFYVRAVSSPVRSVGVLLLPGAAPLLFGVPARELAEAHTVLDDVWRDAGVFREQLDDACSATERLGVLERLLLSRLRRLPRVRGVHPVVADAIAGLRSERVASIVERSGYSHRAFLTLFQDAVGLTPKMFARVLRVQRTIALLGRGESIAAVATAVGYADQAHCARELREIAGVSPTQYQRLCPDGSNHVPIR